MHTPPTHATTLLSKGTKEDDAAKKQKKEKKDKLAKKDKKRKRDSEAHQGQQQQEEAAAGDAANGTGAVAVASPAGNAEVGCCSIVAACCG